MKKITSKKLALKLLGIKDMSDLTDDKYPRLALLLNAIDPKIASELMSNISDINKAGVEVVEEYCKLLNKAMDNGSENSNLIIKKCLDSSEVLHEKLRNESLSVEEVKVLDDEIIKFIRLAMEEKKVQEEYVKELIKYWGKFAFKILGFVVVTITSIALLTAQKDDENELQPNEYLMPDEQYKSIDNDFDDSQDEDDEFDNNEEENDNE